MVEELTKKNYEGIIKSGKPVLIEFYKNDCGPCQELEPTLELLSKKYGDKLIFARSHLTQGGLAEQYGITNTPVLVLLEKGELKTRITGLRQNIGSVEKGVVSYEHIEKRLLPYLGNPCVYYTQNNGGLEDKLNLTPNQFGVLERRYLQRSEYGEILETPDQLFRRVASNIASADKNYGKNDSDIKALNKEFYNLLTSFDFLPNSPTLMNAGKGEQQLSACFVLPIEDDMKSIAYNGVGNTAMIHKSGGGTGFSFSKLRPKDDFVSTTYGKSSGPVSFMDAIDRMTEAVNQGGFRRGANMGILRVDHPDIRGFIRSKSDLDLKNQDVYEKIESELEYMSLDEMTKEEILELVKTSLSSKQLNNFNISVALTDDFMNAVKNNKKYNLINPRNGKVVKEEDANEIFNLIAEYAWRNGEPGVIFIDTINRSNPTPQLGVIESTNPCGEQPLLPYEACNLGSINLGHIVNNCEVDYSKLEYVVKTAVHFLDNVIDMSRFPKTITKELFENGEVNLEKIREMVNGNRKIGLGVMGFADMLVNLKIPYDSERALELAEKIMSFIDKKGKEASVELAKEKGAFPNRKGGIYDKESEYFNGKDLELRNATITTIAPTGTIGMIADCSSGIEPHYKLVFTKTVMDGTKMNYVIHGLEEILKENNLYNEGLIKKLEERGSFKDLEVPDSIKEIFKTAHDISPEWHVRMQAIFQKHTDNAVSKTINFPETATIEDVKNVYLLAYELGCKGITVYRDKSRPDQVLTTLKMEKGVEKDNKNIERGKVTFGPMVRIPIGRDQLGRDRSAFMYLGINKDGKPVETFIITGKSGGEIQALNEAIGRSVSELLQNGIPLERIVDMYRGIRGDSQGFEEDVIIHSPPDGLARVAERHLNGEYLSLMKKVVDVYELSVKKKQKYKKINKKLEENKTSMKNKSEIIQREKDKCPDCGSTSYGVINQEGCIKFDCCGYSPKGCG